MTEKMTGLECIEHTTKMHHPGMRESSEYMKVMGSVAGIAGQMIHCAFSFWDKGHTEHMTEVCPK